VDFIAIDVETANADMSSICQIGIVDFRDGKVFQEHSISINPETWFDVINSKIHGISAEDVESASKFPNFFAEFSTKFESKVIVSHTHFDRVSILRACEKYSLAWPNSSWLDSAKVARRTWPEIAKSGYGLANLAKKFDLDLNHHNALSDARTAGHILLRAANELGLSISQLLAKQTLPVVAAQTLRRTGDGTGGLAGETIVFTGALIIPRREAADRAAQAGGDVSPSITATTSILVVGDQDIQKLAGKEKSSKHLKAEQLISKGQNLRIIGETDFLAISAIVD
jgi:DNA polymerase III subunit epsilon